MDERKFGPIVRSRRAFLRQMASLGICLPFAEPAFASFLSPSPLAPSPEQHARPAPPPAKTYLSPDDDQFLDELERVNVCYFWEQANPQTGLVKDRCNARKATTDNAVVASIAATGFGLSALCIGEKRGFISPAEARTRVLELVALSLEDPAPASRIFLPLRQRQHRRATVGFGNLFGGYRHSALRHPVLPPALRQS